MAMTYSISDSGPLSQDPRFLLGYHNAELAQKLAQISSLSERDRRESNAPGAGMRSPDYHVFPLIGDSSVVGALAEVARRLGLDIQIVLHAPNGLRDEMVIVNIPISPPTVEEG